MSFVDSIDLLSTHKGVKPSKKKPIFPVNDVLRSYLKKNEREVSMPVSYKDLLNFSTAVSLKDKSGNDTLWKTLFYESPH
jgi:hypothetical protein